MSRFLLLLPVLLFGAALASACGGSSSSSSSDSGPPPTPAASLSIKAQNLKFDKNALAAPAGASVTVAFDNEDSGAQHNFSVYEDKSAKKAIFKGDLFGGKATKNLTFTAPAAGKYYFRCDVHPDMNGTFYVD